MPIDMAGWIVVEFNGYGQYIFQSVTYGMQDVVYNHDMVDEMLDICDSLYTDSLKCIVSCDTTGTDLLYMCSVPLVKSKWFPYTLDF